MIYWLMQKGTYFLIKLLYGIDVISPENIPKEGGGIIAMNHASFLDPILASHLSHKRKFCWLARGSLTENWLYRFLTKPINIVGVRRGEADLGAMKTAMSLVEKGELLVMFPEGTRSRDGSIGPFRAGFHLAARKSGAPVIPVRVCGSFENWPRHRKFPKLFGGQRIQLRVGDPIQTKGLSREVAAEITRQAVLDLSPEPSSSP